MYEMPPESGSFDGNTSVHQTCQHKLCFYHRAYVHFVDDTGIGCFQLFRFNYHTDGLTVMHLRCRPHAHY